MAWRKVQTRVGPLLKDGRRFGGLSDRVLPTQLSRIENPDLLNVDFSEGAISQRNGMEIASPLIRDTSLRLDGFNDYVRIAHIAAYQPAVSTQKIYVGIGVVLRAIPATAITIFSKGFGGAGSLFFRLDYDPTVGTGVWRMSVRDATAGATRTFDIADGDLIQEPIGRYRFIEWYGGRNLASVFRFTSDTGSVSTSATTTAIQSFISSAQDFTLGIPMSAAKTISTSAAYANITIAEVRYAVSAVGGTFSGTFPLGVYNRELNDLASPTELSLMTGYWKLNDGGVENTLADSSTNANPGYLEANSAKWTTTASECLGTSAIDFRGTQSWVWLKDLNANFARVFSATTPNAARWTLRGVYVPKYPPGTISGNMPDQVLFWQGTNPALPSPVGIYVASNNFVAVYNDNGTLRTLTIAGLAVSTLVGQRIRLAFIRTGTGTGNLMFLAAVPSGTNTYITYNATTTASTGASPSVVSTNAALGRLVTSFSYPFTYDASLGGPCTGVLDDWQLIWTNTILAGSGYVVGVGYNSQLTGNGGPLNETFDWTQNSPYHSTAWNLKFNEGSGNFLKVDTQFTGTGQFAAYLMPEEGDGGRWDIGLVDPYTPPEITYLKPYDRFLSDGRKRRTLHAISGATLYAIDVDDRTATPMAAGLYKCGSNTRWTSAQYGSLLVLASENKQRPVVYDGSQIKKLGIAPPLSPPVITLAGAGGTFAAQQYYAYYTFMDSLTGAESNPSPGTAFTPAANGKIDVVTLSTSSDPQVNRRRIYITLAGGADGSTAYKARDIEDNVTTVYGSAGADSYDITAPPVSGTAISSTSGYFDRQEAPQASVAEVWRDYLWLGGNQNYPTRVYRNVNAGQITAWDQDVYYIDADNNSGDPVTGFIPGYDRLYVDFEDGRAAIYLTGSSAAPVASELIQNHHGMVGPLAKSGGVPEWFYISERDIYVTNGYQEENISSPDGPFLPSIQRTLRERLNLSRRKAWSSAFHRRRDQVWFVVTTSDATRNDEVLVYQRNTKAWSRYDLQLDVVTEYEDGNDDPSLYGASYGRIYRLDTGNFDGKDLGADATVAAVTSRVLSFVGTPLTGVDISGRRVFVYKRQTDEVGIYTVFSNTSSTVTVYETISGVALGDAVVFCGIPFYVDYLWDFGDPTSIKRLRWFSANGNSDNDDNTFRVSFQYDAQKRDWAYDAVTENLINWTEAAVNVDFPVGTLGRTFRFRLSTCGLDEDAASATPFPSSTGRVTLQEFLVDAEETDLR